MTAPALLIAIPLLAGALLGAALGSTPPAASWILIALWMLEAAALAACTRRGIEALATRVSLATILAGGFTAGILLGGHAQQDANHPPLLRWYLEKGRERTAHLDAVLREDAARTTTAVSLTVDVVRADGEPADGGARLTVAGELAAAASARWRAGRTIALDVTLREPLDYRNPGVASDRRRLARQGVVLLGTVKSAALVTILARGSVFSEAAATLRAWVRAGTTAAVGRWSPASAGVVTAILIGDRTGLSPEDERRLQEAGTYHVIAISGGNIALLTAMLVGLGRAARLPLRPTAVASIAVLAFYGYAAGLAPSVLRATVAGMIYLAARAADQRGAALNAIGVAAACAAATAPLTLLDPGFVLSFGATFAIILTIRRLAPAPIPRKERHPARLRRALAAAAFAARMLGAATLCAEIALAPVGARIFGRVSLAGLFLNFIAIPLMSIIQVAGMAAVALVHVWAAAGGAAGWIAHAGTVGLLWSASLVDVAPWLVIDLPPPAWWVIAGWYAGWTVLLLSRRRVARIPAAALSAAAAVAAVTAMPIAAADRVSPPPSGWTRLVFIDVGQGDATLLMPAGGAPILVDAGGVAGASFDLGRRVTLPAVWAFGARRLAALALTHGDPDHIGGAPALLRALHPREIWDGVPVPRHEPMQRLRAAAARARIPWIERKTGETLAAGSLALRILNPSLPDWERQRVRNDDSIVMEARVGGVAILLPGDITQAIEPSVLAAFDRAPLVIVKAPHHGSAGSSSARFVSALHPAAVIFSAGARNPFGHPAPGVLERYRVAGAQVFSTAEDGAIVLDTDGRSVFIWCPATGRRESFMVSGR